MTVFSCFFVYHKLEFEIKLLLLYRKHYFQLLLFEEGTLLHKVHWYYSLTRIYLQLLTVFK